MSMLVLVKKDEETFQLIISPFTDMLFQFTTIIIIKIDPALKLPECSKVFKVDTWSIRKYALESSKELGMELTSKNPTFV